MASIHKVSPPESELLYQESGVNVPCPVAGCGKILPTKSNLRLHLVKVHKVFPSASETRLYHGQAEPKTGEKATKVQYHCPKDGCVYNAIGTRHFNSLKNLKQHYMHIHAEKKFKCQKCGFGFGLEAVLRRHLVNCGRIFSCDVCKCPYSTREALLTHCARKLHPVPQKYLQQSATASSRELPAPKLISVQMPVCPNTVSTASMPVNVHRECIQTQTGDTQKGIPVSEPVSLAESITPRTVRTSLSGGTVIPDKSSTLLIPVPAAASVSGQQCTQTVKSTPLVTAILPACSSSSQSSTVSTAGPKLLLPKPNLMLVSIPPFSSASQVLYISDVRSYHCTSRGNIPIAPTQGVSTAVPSGDFSQSSPLDLSPCKKTIHIQTDISRRHRKRRSACKASMSTQTLSSVSHMIRNVAQTQTTGDFILKQAMHSANIPTRKESKSSQVSPRAKLKRELSSVQTSETQTSGSPRSSRKRRRRKSHQGAQVSLMETPSMVSTYGDMFPTVSLPSSSAPSSVDNNTRPQSTMVSAGSFADLGGGQSDPNTTLSSTETQTLLEELEATLAESISTQTLESYLADGPDLQVANNNGNIQRQHCGAQTHCSLVGNNPDDLHTVDQSVLCSLDFGGNPPTSSIGLFSSTSFNAAVSNSMASTSTNSDPSFAMLSSTESKSQQTMEFSLEALTDENEVASTAETQTCTSDLDLSSLLNSSSSQTGDYTGYMNMETQTGSEEGMLRDFFNNMHTQTSEGYLTDLSFSDIETQTPLNVLENSPLSLIPPPLGMEKDTTLDPMTIEDFDSGAVSQMSAGLQVDLPFSEIERPTNLSSSQTDMSCVTSLSAAASTTVETQTSVVSLGEAATPSTDNQTQTLFPELDLGPDLTDSHTQTSLNDLMSLVKNLQ